MHETTNTDINFMTKKQILDAVGYKGHPGCKKKLREPATAHNVMIADSDWNELPEPKPDHVRKAIRSYVISGLK